MIGRTPKGHKVSVEIGGEWVELGEVDSFVGVDPSVEINQGKIPQSLLGDPIRIQGT